MSTTSRTAKIVKLVRPKLINPSFQLGSQLVTLQKSIKTVESVSFKNPSGGIVSCYPSLPVVKIDYEPMIRVLNVYLKIGLESDWVQGTKMILNPSLDLFKKVYGSGTITNKSSNSYMGVAEFEINTDNTIVITSDISFNASEQINASFSCVVPTY